MISMDAVCEQIEVGERECIIYKIGLITIFFQSIAEH